MDSFHVAVLVDEGFSILVGSRVQATSQLGLIA